MDNLSRPKTKNTLGVEFDSSTGMLELAGSSFPENASEFFNPIIDWLQQFMLEVTGKITLNFKLDYLNSSSIKFVSDMLEKLEMYHKGGGDVQINWYYDENDEDIQEMGEDLKEDFFNVLNKFEKTSFTKYVDDVRQGNNKTFLRLNNNTNMTISKLYQWIMKIELESNL